ncbi:MAG: rod shape-determining protein MreC [Candidatus Uhrbacteria bacterium]
MSWLKRWKIFSRFWPPVFFVILILAGAIFFPRVTTFLVQPLVWLGSEINKLPVFVSADCSKGQEQLLALAFDRVELENLKSENEELRKQLNFFARQSFTNITARIINRSASTVDGLVVIDRGSDGGVIKEAAVIAADGYLVGRVVTVYPKISLVRPLLSRSSKITASILNSSRTIGLATGTGGALLTLQFVPQDQVFAVNDLIVTSGLESGIPSGLIIGVVTSIIQDSAAPFQTATVEPLVDIRRSSIVSVVILPAAL